MISGTSGNDETMRHAALALHAVSPADRSWLLERLPSCARDELEPLMRELASLGIPSDPSFITRMVRPAVKQHIAEEIFFAGNAAYVANIMSGEPDRVIANIASRGDLQWRASFIAQLPKDVQTRLKKKYDGVYPACPPRLAHAIHVQLKLTLSASPTKTIVAQRTWTSRLQQRLLGAIRSRAA